MLDIIQRNLSAFGGSRWDDFKATLAPDAVYEDIATGQRANGAADYVTSVQRWKRAFPDLRANWVGGFANGDRTVAEVEWEGTHTGRFDGPFGPMEATNKRGRVKAVLLCTLKNGKIVEAHHYFDLLTLLKQIGLAPGAGTFVPASPDLASVPRW